MDSWWVHSYVQNGQYVVLLSWIFWVLFSITFHELAHGWTAIWQGDRTPIELNRMTANPIVQMGTHSLIIFAICGIAWGQMPVNPHRFRDGRRGDIYVSAAGPAMNLLIGAVCTLLLVLWLKFCPAGTNLYQNIAIFLFYGVGLNFVLAPLNLLPIPPLDGSHILAGFSNKARDLYNHPQAPLFGMMLFMVIFFMTPIGSMFFSFAWLGAILIIDALGGLVGNPGIYQIVFG